MRIIVDKLTFVCIIEYSQFDTDALRFHCNPGVLFCLYAEYGLHYKSNINDTGCGPFYFYIVQHRCVDIFLSAHRCQTMPYIIS